MTRRSFGFPVDHPAFQAGEGIPTWSDPTRPSDRGSLGHSRTPTEHGGTRGSTVAVREVPLKSA